MNSALRRESQGSLNSSASLDLGFLAFVSSKSEVSGIWGGEHSAFLVRVTASSLHGFPAFPADVCPSIPSLPQNQHPILLFLSVLDIVISLQIMGSCSPLASVCVCVGA